MAQQPTGLEVFLSTDNAQDMELLVQLKEEGVLYQVDKVLKELSILEQKHEAILTSIAAERRELEAARTELNTLWGKYQKASLEERPGVLEEIAPVNLRVEAILARIGALGG